MVCIVFVKLCPPSPCCNKENIIMAFRIYTALIDEIEGLFIDQRQLVYIISIIGRFYIQVIIRQTFSGPIRQWILNSWINFQVYIFFLSCYNILPLSWISLSSSFSRFTFYYRSHLHHIIKNSFFFSNESIISGLLNTLFPELIKQNLYKPFFCYI